MRVGHRWAALAATGIAVAGVAHAGWLASAWVAQGASPWLPVLAQLALTAVLAAAVAWHLARDARALEQTLDLLREQADALEQGRFVVVEVPPLAEAGDLARSLNAAVRRLRSVVDMPGQGASALRRSARVDPESGLDGRHVFLRQLTERLADRQHPETALLVLRLLPSAPGAAEGAPQHTEQAVADVTELLRVYPSRVPGAFVGRLTDADFALCLPAHGVVHDSADSLMAATQAAPGHVRCVAGALDQLAGVSLATALALADRCVERAEQGGSGHVEYRSARDDDEGTDGAAVTRTELLDALRAGAWKLGEFPVLDGHGQLLHLECPMRLRLRADGPFEPADGWLAAASRHRLMTQIDLAALELALRACAADGLGRCVHVAAESLSTAGFVSAVRARLEQSPEAAARLWIEIAEVSFERLPPQLRNAGTVWRRAGARVGIEHAGAALRSLLGLGTLEVDYVKVDASFVTGVAEDLAQAERARALVALVHEMGARVFAEGADAAADLDALWALGFDGATGCAATQRYAAAPDQAMSPA